MLCRCPRPQSTVLCRSDTHRGERGMDFSALKDSLVMRGRPAAPPDVLWAEAAVTDAYELDLLDGGHLDVDVMRRAKAPAVRVRAVSGGSGRAPGVADDV